MDTLLGDRLTKYRLQKEHKPYLYLTVAICAVLLFYKLIDNISSIAYLMGSFLQYIYYLVKPLIGGLLIGYSLYRPVEYFDKKLIKANIFKRNIRLARVISIILAYIILIIALYLALMFMIPQIWGSVETLLNNVPIYMKGVQRVLRDFHLDGEFAHFVNQFEKNISPSDGASAKGFHRVVLGFMNNKDLSVNATISYLLNSLNSLSGFLLNMTLSSFLAIYLLLDRETIFRQLSSVGKHIMSKSTYNNWVKTLVLVDEVFYKFFIGKIYCSIFVSVIVFLGLVILKVKHGLLISLIVAVTNIIPYFGPLIGGSVGLAITFFNSPIKALWLLLLLLVVQQIDDNILVPKVVGSQIGLRPFWIMISVIIGGQIFGIFGMILAVPFFGVMKVLFTQWFLIYKNR